MITLLMFMMTLFLVSFSMSKDFLMKMMIFIFLYLLMIPNKIILFSHLNFFLYLNEMSFLLGLLVLIFMYIIIIIETYKEKLLLFNIYIIVILSLEAITLMSFLVSKIFHFFVLFELSLIPIFILIMGWGYQPERKYASMLMIFYTMTASLPLMVVIMMMKNKSMIFFMNNYYCHFYKYFIKDLMFMMASMAFLVKFPMFSLHIWLPHAHVEAPLIGSMILAAILLKLGGYGMYKIINLYSINFHYFMKIIFSVALMGGSLSVILCIQQLDMKVIIAYSSVTHMALAITSLLSNSSISVISSIIIFISHGFSSAAMFFSANEIYLLSNSRNILLNKSILLFSPFFSFLWFLICMSNMAGPPSFNLLGEILASLMILKLSSISMIPIFIMMLFSVVFNLILYTSTSHGQVTHKKLKIYSNYSFILILLNHIFFIFYFPLITWITS